LKNGIQVKGMGMGPGFHRGDNNAGMTEIESDFSSTNSQSLSNRRARHDEHLTSTRGISTSTEIKRKDDCVELKISWGKE
jgi:hypothetical protein